MVVFPLMVIPREGVESPEDEDLQDEIAALSDPERGS